MTAVIVFGERGMLGQAVCASLLERGHLVIDSGRVDISEARDVARIMADGRARWAVNCAGAIPAKNRRDYQIVQANTVGPMLIAEWADRMGKRVLHVSTDCVFSGVHASPHYDTALPNASDLYGQTKGLGEVRAQHVTNVRTSFVGPAHGLWRWLVEQPPGATVEGWTRAMWSGSTVWDVADALVDIVEADTPGGTYHLATERAISKCRAIDIIDDALGLGLDVHPTFDPYIYRTLRPSSAVPLLRPFEDAMRAAAERISAAEPRIR